MNPRETKRSEHQRDQNVVSILENFSRAILASAISPRQDLRAYLTVLRAAARQRGAPETLVSDSGGVFLAKEAKRIYEALSVEKDEIAPRQAWQNYIEAQFNVQRRMAGWHLAQAENWAQLREMLDRWVADFNERQHWAHRERQDDRHSPAEVLGWIHGAVRTDEVLDRIFRIFRMRAGRRIAASGYLRYRHWRLYAERSLARRQADIWLVGETLAIEHAEEPLSQFTVEYQQDKKHLRKVKEPRLLEHRFVSPQPFLWPEDAVVWRVVQRLPDYAARRRRQGEGRRVEQLPLFLVSADALRSSRQAVRRFSRES
jgi:hypothetical protein